MHGSLCCGHLISHITVSTAGSLLTPLMRDLLEAAPPYVAAHFLKWHPGAAERREQTHHAGGGDTLRHSKPLQLTQAPLTKPQPGEPERERESVCVGVSICVRLWVWLRVGGACLLLVSGIFSDFCSHCRRLVHMCIYELWNFNGPVTRYFCRTWKQQTTAAVPVSSSNVSLLFTTVIVMFVIQSEETQIELFIYDMHIQLSNW